MCCVPQIGILIAPLNARLNMRPQYLVFEYPPTELILQVADPPPISMKSLVQYVPISAVSAASDF